MDDPEVVAAIAAGDPAGIAAAYDKYADALYGYCRWMLRDPADAAGALQDTFVIATATIEDLPEADKLRPWLYALARNEWRLRLRTSPAARGTEADPGDQEAGAMGAPAQTDLSTSVRAVLTELKPDEREVVELVLRHHLYGDGLAITLGVPRSQADAMAARARGQLEKALGPLVIARTGREACTALDALLADRDGQLDGPTRDMVSRHIDTCETCTSRKFGALRPAVMSGLLLADLPAGLREQVLVACSSTAPHAVAYRRRAVRRTGARRPTRFAQALRRLGWASIRRNPGVAAATVAVMVWVAAAVSVSLLAFAGSHSARALAAQPSIRTSASSPAAAAVTTTAPTSVPTSAAASPSPTIRPSPTYVPPPYAASASPTVSATPSPSHSPKPSHSPQPSKSPSPSPSRSGSPSASASPSPSKKS